MKKILIAPDYAMANLAETHRMSSIAEALLDLGHEVYVLGQGRFDDLFNDERYHWLDIPFDHEFMTNQKYEEMHTLDKNGFNFFSEKELDTFVQEELAILKQLTPDVVINGFRPSMAISTKIAGIPYVSVMSAVVSDLYERCGLKTVPYGVRHQRKIAAFLIPLIRSRLVADFLLRVVLVRKWYRVWNRVMKKYRLPPFRTLTGGLKGDFNLMADAPELFPEISELPPYYAFSGPLLYNAPIETPTSLQNFRKKKRPVVLMIMGSSGDPQIFRKLIYGFEGKNYDVFCSTTTIINKDALESVPENVHIEKMFPLEKLTEIADAAVIHGGQGTLYSMLFGGTPFVGIPMFGEQQWNLENMARKGCGIILPRPELKLDQVYRAIDEVLNNHEYAENVQKVKQILQGYVNGQHEPPSMVAAREIISFLNSPLENKSYFATNIY
jgi:UDP:flavonoid glycosyltransferase YjiC (YdhE family)